MDILQYRFILGLGRESFEVESDLLREVSDLETGFFMVNKLRFDWESEWVHWLVFLLDIMTG